MERHPPDDSARRGRRGGREGERVCVCECECVGERDRETDRERERHTQREGHTHTHTERERERERERESRPGSGFCFGGLDVLDVLVHGQGTGRPGAQSRGTVKNKKNENKNKKPSYPPSIARLT